MKNFGYCVWYVLEGGHEWHNKTDGFACHITIKKGLTFNDAVRLYHSIKPEERDIEIDKQMIQDDDGFLNMYYTIKEIDQKPVWMPEVAHVSFMYKYNGVIEFQKEMNIRKGRFNKIALVCCDGHYKDWKIIDEK